MKARYALTLLKVLLCVTFLIVVTHLALKYISVQVYNEKHGFIFELSNRFDLNDEASVPQWFSQALFLAIAGLSLVAAWGAANKKGYRLWLAIAVIALIMSIDDVATLHEFVLQSLHNTFFLDTDPTLIENAWLLLLPFILAGALWLFVVMLRTLPRDTMALLVAGGVIFIFGAVVVDSFANTVPSRDFMNQGVLGALEGGLQLLGSVTVLFAIARHLELNHASRIRAAYRQLRPAR